MANRSRTWSAVLIAAVAVAGAEGCASARPGVRPAQVPSGSPLNGARLVITSAFGTPRGRTLHQGIDLSAPAGTAVRSTADGTVVFAGRASAWGRTVLIDHGGGWQTRYAHLKRIEVDQRKRLARGTVVGTVGRSGNAKGAHLHYEVLRDGTPIDPRPYLSQRPSREPTPGS